MMAVRFEQKRHDVCVIRRRQAAGVTDRHLNAQIAVEGLYGLPLNVRVGPVQGGRVDAVEICAVAQRTVCEVRSLALRRLRRRV